MKRLDWLRVRRSHIGGSDVPALVGCGYENFGPREVYDSKVGEIKDTPGNLRMRLGSHNESFVIEEYRKVTDALVLQHGDIVKHPWHNWRGCTPDALRCDTNGIRQLIQVKTMWGYPDAEWGSEGTDQIPDHVLVQVQHELDVCLSAGFANNRTAIVLAMCPNWPEVREYKVEHSPDLCRMLHDLERDFWKRVTDQSGVDGWDPLLRAEIVNRLADIRPGSTVELNGEVELLVLAYEESRASEKDFKSLADGYRQQIRMALGDAESGILSDGRTVRQKVIARSEYTVAATTYVDFRILKAKKKKHYDLPETTEPGGVPGAYPFFNNEGV